MNYFRLIILLPVLLRVLDYTQKREFSLADCIQCAWNGTAVRLTQSSKERNSVEHVISKDSFLPSISLTNQQNLSIGRVLDPTTYQFVTNRFVFDMNASIGSSLTLFSGFERVQKMKKTELSIKVAELEVERTKQDIALEVTRVFLEILMDKEVVAVYEKKIGLLEKQETIIAKKVDIQTATKGDLLNIQSDIARAHIERSDALRELNLDKVAICELLEISDWENFDVVFDEREIPEMRIWDVQRIIHDAQTLPQIRQKEIAVQQANRDVKIAAAAYWPTVKLNAGYGSSFSNVRVTKTGDEYLLYDQLRDNMSSYVTVSIIIPILSAITVSHAVKARKHDVQTSELELHRTLLALDKEIKQAIVYTNTAFENYQLLAKEVEKNTEVLRQTEARYDAGAATYYDYQIAVSNLFQSQAERLHARYEYIYRTKIMDYYSGNSLY